MGLEELTRMDEVLQVSNVMSSLGNDVRLLIFTEAMRDAVKPSEILKKTDITIQALHKQITNLIESGLIQKVDGKIFLTEFGRSIAGLIPTLTFLIKHEKYFTYHNIGILPTRYFHSIGMLRKSEEIQSTVNVLEKIHSIINNSKTNLKMIIVEYFREITQIMLDRLNHAGVSVQYIIDENRIIQKEKESFLKVEEGSSDKKNISKRLIKNANLMMIISETESLLLFPDYQNNIQLNAALYSKDERFHEWCQYLFDDVWKNSHEYV